MQRHTSDIEKLIVTAKEQGYLLFKPAELQNFISQKRTNLNIPKSYSYRKVLSLLIETGYIEEILLEFPFRREVRYAIQKPPLFELLQMIYPKAYFSHATAAVFNNLLPRKFETIYLNNEQKPIPRPEVGLTQEKITLAFKNKPRITTNITKYQNYNICLINGKNTQNAGVIVTTIKTGETVRITSVERTLIDMVVRPFYSGGSTEVLKAFQNAHSRVAITRLKELLKTLNFVYPYHQSIGFYMEQSGVYTENEIEEFNNIEMHFDFFLCNAISNIAYSKKWKLFYPRELTNSVL
jgi:hypothetical protein